MRQEGTVSPILQQKILIVKIEQYYLMKQGKPRPLYIDQAEALQVINYLYLISIQLRLNILLFKLSKELYTAFCIMPILQLLKSVKILQANFGMDQTIQKVSNKTLFSYRITFLPSPLLSSLDLTIVLNLVSRH